MSSSVSRIVSPEERELTRYFIRIEELNRDIAGLQAEWTALQEDLARFNAEYHLHVGSLLIEIDRLTLEEAEYRRRIELLRRRNSPDQIDDQIHQEFASERERIDNDEAQSHRFRDQAHQFAQEPQLAESEAGELRRLLRELSKRFHPDLARTAAERLKRTKIMQQVTAAFHDRDLDALRRLMEEQDITDEAFDSLSIGERLVWAIREVSRLEQMREMVIGQMEQLRSSSLGMLWTRYCEGEDIIGQLEADAKRRIQIARRKLQDAKEALVRYEAEA